MAARMAQLQCKNQKRFICIANEGSGNVFQKFFLSLSKLLLKDRLILVYIITGRSKIIFTGKGHLSSDLKSL